MDFRDCLKFASDNPVSFIATMDRKMPRVRAFLMKSPSDPVLAIFRIPKGEAWFWSMAENMREAEIPRIKF
jgi:hypothetical protein